MRPRKIGVAFDELFRAVIGETHGELAVVVFAIHVDDGAHAVGWMVHALADERIAAAFDTGGDGSCPIAPSAARSLDAVGVRRTRRANSSAE